MKRRGSVTGAPVEARSPWSAGRRPRRRAASGCTGRRSGSGPAPCSSPGTRPRGAARRWGTVGGGSLMSKGTKNVPPEHDCRLHGGGLRLAVRGRRPPQRDRGGPVPPPAPAAGRARRSAICGRNRRGRGRLPADGAPRPHPGLPRRHVRGRREPDPLHRHLPVDGPRAVRVARRDRAPVHADPRGGARASRSWTAAARSSAGSCSTT